jgi:hypothetical protein
MSKFWTEKLTVSLHLGNAKKNAGLTGPACNSVKHSSLLNHYLFGENGGAALVYHFHQVYASLCVFR